MLVIGCGGQEWEILDRRISAWADELADASRSAIQWEGYLWTYLYRDLGNGLFDESEPLRNGSRLSLRVIDKRSRQAHSVKGRTLCPMLRPMGDRIIVTKEALLGIAGRYGVPPPLRWSNATKGASQPSRSRELKPASKAVIRDENRSVYKAAKAAGRDGPNINKLADEVQPRLEQKGFEASKRLIKEIGGEDEFKRCRRPPGRTLASERRKK